MTQPNNIFNRMKLKFMAQQQKVKQCSHYSPGMMMLDVDELRDIEANWKEVLAEMEGYLMQELNDCNMMAAKMGNQNDELRAFASLTTQIKADNRNKNIMIALHSRI